jgi:hypothetical protein
MRLLDGSLKSQSRQPRKWANLRAYVFNITREAKRDNRVAGRQRDGKGWRAAIGATALSRRQSLL